MSVGVIAAHYVAGPAGSVTFESIASASVVTSGPATIAMNYPTVKTAGHIVLGLLSLKDPLTPTNLSSPWTAWVTEAGGAGSHAVDTGPTRMCVCTKVLTGSEGASESISLSGGPSPGITNMLRYSGVDSSGIATAGGSDSSTGAALSVAFGTDPGFQTGDVAVWLFSATTDDPNLTNYGLTIPGCTVGAGTLRLQASTVTGLDGCIWAGEFPITAGTSSGAATFTATSSTNLGAGPMILVRLRPV